MAAVDHTPEERQDTGRIRYTPVDDFRRQFQSLVDQKVCFELVGSLPAGNQDGPEVRREVSVYSGTDWLEAFKQALKWNCKGYNILFTPTDSKGFLEFEWLGLSAVLDYSTINRADATEHALDVNLGEFDGKANVLDTGDRFWFLIKLPSQKARLAVEPSRLRKCIRWYCTNLGLKWNIVARDVISFHVDNADFFPGMNMPAAGFWNYELNPPCRITWINDMVNEPQSGFFTKILETKDLVKEMMTIYSNLDSSSVKRNISFLNINPDFTEKSLTRLLETNVVARKIFKDDNRSWKIRDTLEADISRLLLLRACSLASVNVIERILSMTGGLRSPGSGDLSGYDRTELLRGIVAVDEYIRSIRDHGGCRMRSNPDDKARGIDIHSLTTFNPMVPYDIAMRTLFHRYGPQIHFAQNGWYLLRIEKFPQEIVSIRDRVSRTRTYMPVPCSFWIVENNKVCGKGAILLPIDIAERFCICINLDGLIGIVIAAYFWYHGKNFSIFGISPEFTEDHSDMIGRLDRWAQLFHPEILKLKRFHEMDRDRKTSNRMGR